MGNTSLPSPYEPCAEGSNFTGLHHRVRPHSAVASKLLKNLLLELSAQVAQKDRVKNGELYRYIADNHGVFVQPAKYEAFGLTVSCAFPTRCT